MNNRRPFRTKVCRFCSQMFFCSRSDARYCRRVCREKDKRRVKNEALMATYFTIPKVEKAAQANCAAE